MRLFITGGAGYLGREIVKRFYDEAEITIYSRDEAKHYYLKKQFPKIRCVIGDVADFKLMNKAAKGHDYGIFAASLKQIEAVDQNVDVAIRTIINGAINSRNVTAEIISDGKNGFLIENPDDEKVIANLILKVLQQRELLETAFEINQKIAKERLDYMVNQQKILALYQQIENDTCE